MFPALMASFNFVPVKKYLFKTNKTSARTQLGELTDQLLNKALILLHPAACSESSDAGM